MKRYVIERGTAQVHRLVRAAELPGTALVSRIEVVAALAKAVRVGALSEEEARRARDNFLADWDDLIRLGLPGSLAARAGDLAWAHGLRSYDALHLATASSWAELMGEPVTFATFDRNLWSAAGREGLDAWPDDLPALLDAWRTE